AARNPSPEVRCCEHGYQGDPPLLQESASTLVSPGRRSAGAGRLALLRGDGGQSFLEGGGPAEPRHLAGFMSARGVEVLRAATAGGLVGAARLVGRRGGPGSGAGGGAPGVGSARPCCVSRRAGPVRWVDTRWGITAIL